MRTRGRCTTLGKMWRPVARFDCRGFLVAAEEALTNEGLRLLGLVVEFQGTIATTWWGVNEANNERLAEELKCVAPSNKRSMLIPYGNFSQRAVLNFNLKPCPS